MKEIKRIAWRVLIFAMLLMLISCSNSTNYAVSIKQIDCEGSTCNLRLEISEDGLSLPEFLITLDRPPVDGSDGIRIKGTEISLDLKEAGSHTIFVTLVDGKRFLSTPVSKEVIINLNPPDAPDLTWSLSQGELKLSLRSDSSDSVTDYRILVNNVLHSSTQGTFSFPVDRDAHYVIQAFSVAGNLRSDPSILDLKLSEDFAPEVELTSVLPFTNGAVDITVVDDWDRTNDLSIKAFLEESNILLLFDGNRLIPEIPLPEGINTLVVRVADSSGNVTELKRELKTVRKTSVEIPELYIEEGTIRNARWTTPKGMVELQRYIDGEWITLSTHSSEEESSIIAKDSISEKGDLYRIVVDSDNEKLLPSVPVFAKESLFRRFSTEFISSFLGMDALLVGGNSYRFYGNIVVRENTVMRVESGTSLTIPRGNTLLVSGVLDLEGWKDRIKVNPGGSSGTIEVTNNGVLIARSVDFNNSTVSIENAAVAVFEDCTLSGDLKISGARTVQIYNSQFSGDMEIENVRELLVHQSDFSGSSLVLSGLGRVLLSRSSLRFHSLEIVDSRLEAYESLFEAEGLFVRKTSHLLQTRGALIETEISVSGASSIHIEEPNLTGDVKIELRDLSRLSLQKDLEGSIEIVSDEKSAIKVF
ncbi:hypothetical protein [Mesotoga prima]|uniref:hypothetical protein n=1 Tax=Mesotoga prima TaxID=1184387 RepID=UPI002BCE822B|nr:hypothetical protein [Mesotoga prima]HOZ99318.1 hypothetical protein [Mesotoga prima]HPE53220.1 hypothetical protein [Mesotoga prima]